jgi:2-dehydropantoate 2-reductase
MKKALLNMYVIGSIDEVTSLDFSQPSSRPNYFAGIVNHGVFKTGQFSASHVGLANIVLGPVFEYVKNEQLKATKDETPFLLKQIISCPPLNASVVPAEQLRNIQLQKLVINAVINPLTVVFNCHNGEIFNSASRLALIETLIAEISSVIRAIVSANSETADVTVLEQFSEASLRKIVFDIGAKTARNISSMRQDVLAGRETEIHYINGYIISRASHLGMKCPINEKLVALVNEKNVISDSQIPELFKI